MLAIQPPKLFRKRCEPIFPFNFRDTTIVKAGGENIVPLLEADEVIVFKGFIKAGLRFPLHTTVGAI